MEKVEALRYRLAGAVSFSERYPEFAMHDGMVHVLFLAPRLDGSGYYRMICPALELNRSGSHRAIVSHILPADFTKRTEDFDLDPELEDALLKWADYIVLPLIYRGVSKMLDRIRTINPQVRVAFDMDTNVFEYPEDHPGYAKVTDDDLEQLWMNLAAVDAIHCASKGLSEYIAYGLQEQFPESTATSRYVPSLVSEFTYAGISKLSKNDNGKVRIGLIGTPAQAGDLLTIQDTLHRIVDKYEAGVELIFFGWNGRGKEGSTSLNGLVRSYQKSVAFPSYFEQLNALRLDLALIPHRESLFNSHGRSIMPFLELSAFSIPVVATDSRLFRAVVKPQSNGLLAKDPQEWESAISAMIEQKEQRLEMGRQAFKNAWRNHSYLAHAELLVKVYPKFRWS